MKYIHSFSTAVFCVSLVALATGCTHMVNISVQTTTLPAGGQMPLHAELVLNKELSDYKHEFHMMGDTWVYPFGPPLLDYARNVSSASFQKVQEAPSLEKAFADSSADIVLIPRPVKAEQSQGLMAASKINLTLIVEWMAKDRASQNTVWLKTITADASETQGNVFTGKDHQRILMQKLFDDLSIKTYKAFQNAPELRSITH